MTLQETAYFFFLCVRLKHTHKSLARRHHRDFFSYKVWCRGEERERAPCNKEVLGSLILPPVPPPVAPSLRWPDGVQQENGTFGTHARFLQAAPRERGRIDAETTSFCIVRVAGGVQAEYIYSLRCANVCAPGADILRIDRTIVLFGYLSLVCALKLQQQVDSAQLDCNLTGDFVLLFAF